MFLKSLILNILRIATESPNKTVLMIGNSKISYAELWRMILDSIKKIKNANAIDKCRVGIYLNNSVELYPAILSCICQGYMYVPLSIDNPKLRIIDTIKKSCVELIMCSADNFYLLNEVLQSDENLKKIKIIIIEKTTLYKDIHISDINLTEIKDENPVYMLYTSGSTGSPKGVMISGECIANVMSWTQSYLNLTSTDIFLASITPTFDLSLLHIIGPLLCGGSVVIPTEKAEFMYPGTLLKKGITVAMFVPRITYLMIQADQFKKNAFPQLRHLLFCGERLLARQVRPWIETNDSFTIHNMYGPTEATMYCSYYTLPKNETINDPIPIGQPLAGVSLQIDDLSGELLIAGKQVSPWSYDNQSNESFFEHPIYGRCYKTGDLAYRDNSGFYFFNGRSDEQVKIRGHRVELGEIETVLGLHSDIQDIICLYQEETEQTIVVASTTSGEPSQVVASRIKEIAAKNLPFYMRPSKIYIIRDVVKTENGKINRKYYKNLYLK